MLQTKSQSLLVDKESNVAVFSKQGAIKEMIEIRRRRYLGHSLRRKDYIPNTSLSWVPEGSRRRGRPKETGEEKPEAAPKV